jgi:hypothetical protein
MNDEFDAWLTSELERGLGSERPRARFAPARRSRGLTLKATLVAVGAVLLTGGVALAAGTVATGTPNPAVWGQQVQSHVQACQQQLTSGQHGIGRCVSEFAKQHGQQEKAAHSHGAGAHGKAAPGAAGAAHGHGHAAGVNGTPDPNESPDAADSPEPVESPGS